MRKATITVDLGFGDSGKGATVDFLCRKLGCDLVIRYSGGCQCGHNVVDPKHGEHAFSQFGSGTFLGIPTFLDEAVIVDPFALQREAAHLQELGITDPLRLIRMNPNCLVSTQYHQITNQLKEVRIRAKNTFSNRDISRWFGSCGQGIGETRSYWLKYGQDAITYSDLLPGNRVDRRSLVRKLELLRQRSLNQFYDWDGNWFLKANDGEDQQLSHLYLQLLHGDSHELATQLVRIASEIDLETSASVFSFEHAIYEGAQGVLLDEHYGQPGYNTWGTVTPHFALQSAKSYDAETKVVGVTRSYLTRHGAGPFPTYDANLTNRLNDLGNPTNEWQGSMRRGWLNLPLLRYAIKSCQRIDALAVNCLDEVDKDFQIIDASAMDSMEETTGLFLFRSLPLKRVATRTQLQSTTADEILTILNKLCPVKICGFGRTANDRTLTDGL